VPRNPAYRAAGVTIAAALLLSGSTLVAPVVHQLTEAFVRILP
jgi:hypothetical protein